MAVPAAPTGLTVLSQNGSVFLNWAAPSNGGAVISDYRIQRKLASQADSSFAIVADTIKATPGATIACANGVSYIFRVAAVNAAGVGPYSANSAAVTPYGIPSTPAAPTCISGNGQVTLNWTPPANNGSAITDYAIQRKLNGQADTLYQNVIDGVSTANTYTVTGLTNGAGYIFRIAAINARGASLWSAGSAFVTPSTVPNAPTNLVATASYNAATNTAGLINLSWTAPANNGAAISDYVIQRKLEGQADSSFATVVDTVSAATTASIASVNGVSYVFRVAAKNIKGQGSYSANSNAATPSIKPAICPPPICTKGFSQVTLNWSPPSSNGGATITNYIVQRKINGQTDAAYVTLNTGSGNTSYTATGLVNGTAYVFRVAAVNVRGSGPYSPASQLVIPGAVPPGAPTNLVATIVNNTGVSLSWTAPTNNGGASITRYVVQARPDNGVSAWRTVSTNYAQGVSQPIDGLDDVSNIFQVAAVNAAGTGSYSSVSNAVTPSNNLFDKSSWRNVVSEPYLSYLNKAADRWNKYIKYNSTTRASIATDISGWNGLRLEPGNYTLFTDSSSSEIAACGVYYYTQISGKRYNSASFTLEINDYYRSGVDALTENEWIDAITHELGHALGIGIFWDSYFTGSTPPSNFFLSGTAYSFCQAAYNAITGLTRSLIPLENVGGGGTASAHWENSFRPSSATGSLGVSYPGLTNELMIGYISPNLVLSPLSIKTLVDFGWEEVNAGASEGNPTLVSSISAGITSTENFVKCGKPRNKVEPRPINPNNAVEETN
jgi:hypothetical protein